VKLLAQNITFFRQPT